MKKWILISFFVVLFSPWRFSYAQGYGQNFGGQNSNAKQANPLDMGMNTNFPRPSIESTTSGNGSRQSMAGGVGSTGSTVGMVMYQVHILGQVEKPGTYRLTPSTRLDEAVEGAGGIAENGSLRRIELRRNGVVTHYDLLLFRKKGDLNQNPFLLDNDVVFVSFAEKNISIQGPVRGSGVYELTNREKSVWDVIELSGGFSVGVTNNEPVVIIRFVDGKKTLVKINNTQDELMAFSVQNGDIIIVPHLFGEKRRFDYDVSELPADRAFYPSQRNEVFVTGAVSKQGPYKFNPNYSVRDFTNYAGLTEQSNSHGIYVVTSDGKVIKHPEQKNGFYLSPGDSIIVPKKQWTTDNVLKWYNTATGTVFTAFAFKQLLKSQ